MVQALGLALVLGGVAEAGSATPLERVLETSWRGYKRDYVKHSGRVVDPHNDHRSTSEGQAYGMLRAVWIDDERAFRRMQRWTLRALQGGDRGALPAWLWLDGGVADPQPASDADQLLAYALLLARERWGNPADLEHARALMEALWEQETAEIGGLRLMLPGPWALTQDPVALNPSYFLPFCWRAFARADPDRAWDRLIEDAYAALPTYAAPSGLPRDWVYVDAETGAVVPAPAWGKAHADHHGFEAFRTAFTLAVETVWHDDDRARALLGPYADLATRWRRDGSIPGVMGPTGAAIVDWGYPGFYGVLLAAWAVARPEDVQDLYDQEIVGLARRGGWGDRSDYFSQNWIWFGLASWSGLAQPPEGT